MNRHRLALTLITVVLGLAAACGSDVQIVPTGTPTTQTKSVQRVEPRSQALMLRLASPEINLVTGLDRITVSGVTSPDASLSVNGRLALPDADGNFSADVVLSNAHNPLIIEVVATAITGETESLVRPVIFSDGFSGSGLFGTVTLATPSELTVQTASGQVSLSIDDSTAVSIHGWKSPAVSNIARGALVAVMADGPHADSVLAVVSRPVRTRHFTGVVTGSQPARPNTAGSLTLRDGSGREITAITTGGSPGGTDSAPVGEVVTAVLEQDLSTGNLTVTDIDRALDGAKRLNIALALNEMIDSPEATANMTALRWRLAEHGVRNLSLLVNSQPQQGRQYAIDSAVDAYTKSFSEHHIGAPSADVTGLVTSIATSIGTGTTRLITVKPASGQPVMVKLSDTTPVALFGERIKSGQLDLASRITVRYAISGNNANRVTVMAGNTLSADSSAQLAALAGRGEAQGVLMDVGALESVVTILVDRTTGQQISLLAAGAAIYRNGAPTALDITMEGSNVFARFDPASFRLLELESMATLRGEELVSGVVHSFIPKIADGNLTIRTTDGRLRSFTHRADTSIRRDGLRVSIQDVRLGDLVRPNTRARLPEGPPNGSNEKPGEIVKLSLKAPEPGLVTGIIRGVTGGFDGQVRVTVSNIWLDLISLKVNAATAITQQDRTLGVQDLAVGQEIALASYDPVTLVAAIMALDPPKEPGARASR